MAQVAVSGDKIKVPRRQPKSRIEKALIGVERDGEWYELLTMGFTSAEQTARSFNVPGARWEWGYCHSTNEFGDLVSVLLVRWVG